MYVLCICICNCISWLNKTTWRINIRCLAIPRSFLLTRWFSIHKPVISCSQMKPKAILKDLNNLPRATTACMLTCERAFAQAMRSKKRLRLLCWAHNLTVARLFLFVTIMALKKDIVISLPLLLLHVVVTCCHHFLLLSHEEVHRGHCLEGK